MKKILACLTILSLFSFQKAEKVTVHYPDFIMKMVRNPSVCADSFPVAYTIQAYYKGVLVKGCNDYFSNIDSVAITSAVLQLDRKDFHVDNSSDCFYARTGKYTWKKYDYSKKVIATLTEFRSEIVMDPFAYSFGTKVYYKTR